VTEIVGLTLIKAGFAQETLPVPFAVNEMLVVVHVNTLETGGVIVTDGAVLFCVIVCVAVAVHPFVAVTVTVYVPEVVTFNVAFVPSTAVPLDQEYVPPPVAVNEIVGVVQFTTVVLGAVIAAVGTVILCVIT
jgi:hypothetical protein